LSIFSFQFIENLHNISGIFLRTAFLSLPVVFTAAGILDGLPFLFGMRYILNLITQRTYTWTINGCASISASVTSAQIALGLSISMIMILAISSYFQAFFTLWFKRN